MFTIEPLTESDVPLVCGIIRRVREEHGLKRRLGNVLEPADKALLSAYASERSRYFVARVASTVVGGAGIAPLAGASAALCELQRMYLDAGYRKIGIGKALLDNCIDAARVLGYRGCYAETIRQMKTAIALYESRGFRRLDGPLGHTGHGHNDCWLYLDLSIGSGPIRGRAGSGASGGHQARRPPVNRAEGAAGSRRRPSRRDGETSRTPRHRGL